jgi:DNA polymerase I-like protein with 3'-5' exonuclease and polymerase domains
MQTLGLVEAAAKNYNIHWEFEYGNKVRSDWLAAYVEIDLWHAWTELNPHEQMFVPDPDKGGKFVKKAAYKSVTLGGRTIYTFGLNAALAYQDQSSGADILGLVMDTFHQKYPEVFDTVVNQVHDELVFEVPDEKVEGYTKLISDVMTGCAESLLMPFGVRGECSPAIGDVWVKD